MKFMPQAVSQTNVRIHGVRNNTTGAMHVIYVTDVTYMSLPFWETDMRQGKCNFHKITHRLLQA